MYLVTGATGNVGSEVVSQLLAQGEKVRVFTRDAAKVTHWGDRVEVAVGDFSKPETFAKAVKGVKGVFIVNGGPDLETFKRLMATAQADGKPKIVFLSSITAATPELKIGKIHKDKEDAVREAGLDGKFLRAGGFMSNTYQWIGSIKAEGIVYNAFGSTQFPPVAPEDIAAVAVKTLTQNLPGEIFDVTGGEMLNVEEESGILAKILGRPLRCVDVPMEVAVQGLIRSGVPAELAAAVGESFQAFRERRSGSEMKDTVERLTGRRPMTFEAWARKHAARFA